MRTSKWPVASADSDFDPYLVGHPATSVTLFRRFIEMARACGPVTFELQNGPVVLCGERRIFAAVTVTDRGLSGHLNLPRELEDGRVRKVDSLTRRLFMNGFLLTASSDLDETFAQWLRDAWGVGNGEHLSRPV
jgi:Domain of unknown function (DUF5655)